MKSNKGKMSVGMQNAKGITLLALAVTIVVLLILTSIGIKLALGDNGIIGEAKNAKELAEIDEEKGIVKRATTVSLIKSKGSKVEQDTLEKALNDEAGEGKTDVSDAGDVFEVLFTDSNRYYEVDEEGNISDANKIIKDEYAGDITKGGRCDGSEEKPYEISCIEDLVAFSNIANGSGIKFENGQAVEILNWENFENKNIMLTKNLNFKSKFSYADSTRTDFGDINGDDTDGNMLITEMTTGTGFTPISYSTGTFKGNFNGKEHTISNMYINAAENDKTAKGLFGYAYDAYIGNLTITGEINSNWHTGGIVGEANGSTIENCQNKANIIGYNKVGGIVGCDSATIKNCKNYGTIKLTGYDYANSGAGGIIGSKSNKIDLCENYGEIIGTPRAGGIIGCISGSDEEELFITNCKNEGDVTNTKSGINYSTGTGGILGAREGGGELSIINSYNKGNVAGKMYEGGIIGIVSGTNWDGDLTTNINNCYNLGKVYSDDTAGGIVGKQGTISTQNYLYINNSYNLGKTVGKQIGNIVGIIITATRTDTKTELSNVYYTLEPAIGTGSLTSGEETLKTESEIKSQAFVDLLNSYQDDTGVYPTDWKKWKLGNDGYPTFAD